MKLKSTLLVIGLLGVGFGRAWAGITTGLVSYWPLDVNSGGTTPDASFANNLTVNGAVTVGAGKVGNAFTFSAGQYLGILHDTSNATNGLPIYAAGAYTIAFWVNAAPQLNHYVFAEGNTTNVNPLLILQTPTVATYVIGGVTYSNGLDVILRGIGITPINHLRTTKMVFDSTWHHVAWVDNNGAVSVYVDGQLDPVNFSYTPNNAATAIPLNTTAIGALIRNTTTANLVGSVDDVAIWERALSQGEVQSVMASSIPTPIAARAPTITTTLTGRTNSMGDYVTFSASATGNRPLYYQWLKNGAPLADQTNSVLKLTTLTSSGTNTYSITVSNSVGPVTVGPVPLVVLPDPTPNIPSGLVSYWPLNTLSNSTSSPDLVSQNDLQLANMSAGNLVSGQFSNALSFDGATQYGSETTGVPVYDLATTYTVALWVNGAAGHTNEQVFANGNSTNGNYFFIGPDNTGASGKVDVRINPSLSDTLSTGTAFDGTWHHIVWVDQNGAGLLYIDGVLDQTAYNYTHGALGSVLLNNTTVGALAANPLRDYYNGAVDDVGVWSRRLTYTEIQSIFTSGIPAPPAIVKPSIASLTTQPANLTNGIYQGDTVSFTVNATGTSPLSYQWRSNAVPISGASNPTALTNTLVLTNVLPANSGAFSVIVTNPGGAVTSSVVQLAVIPYTPVTNGTALQVEFNFAAGPTTQPGFSAMTLTGNPATFNGPKVTLSPIGSTSFSDRSRVAPVNNPPSLNQADIYQQFIYSTANTVGTGVDILLQRLAPNSRFGLTLWSFDNGNHGTTDWTENASGSPVVIRSGYFFNGATLPTADFDYTLGALLTSSATGQLDIQGVVDTANTGNVGPFINALRLIANPVIRITSAQKAPDGNLQLIVETQYPGQTGTVLESTDLSPGSWQPATDAVSALVHGPFITLEFPISASRKFYRVSSP